MDISLIGEIDIASIPRERIKEFTDKKGTQHAYAKVVITKLRVPDDRGNDYTVYLTQTDDDKANARKLYVGKFKSKQWGGAPDSTDKTPY